MAVAKYSRDLIEVHVDTQASHSSDLFRQWQKTFGADKALHLRQFGTVKPVVNPGNLLIDANAI